MANSFKGRVTVEVMDETTGAVFHKTVSEDMTMDVAEVGVYLTAIHKGVGEALLASNAQMFKQ